MDLLYPNPEPELSEIVVETTTACNIKCIHCAVSNEGYVIKTLRYESFENIVSIMRRYKPLVKLNGHGETLAHKRFFDMLDVSVGAGCRVVFQTNATLLVPEVSKRLLTYAGHDKLISISISIDGVGDVFNKIRRKANWDEYVNNIQFFRDLRTASQSPYPSLTFQFTTMLLNIHTLPATVAMVKALGGTAITVGDLQEYPTAGGQSVTRDLAYARPFFEMAKRLAKDLGVEFVPFPSLIEEMDSIPYDIESPLPPEKSEYATPIILWESREPGAPPVPIAQSASSDPPKELPQSTVAETDDLHSEMEAPVSAEATSKIVSMTVPRHPVKPGMVRVKECTDPWKFAFVQADGGVRPCCWILYTMGNLNNQSFESIWYSEKYKDLRAAVASPNPPAECWRCQARGWKLIPETTNSATDAIDHGQLFNEAIDGEKITPHFQIVSNAKSFESKVRPVEWSGRFGALIEKFGRWRPSRLRANHEVVPGLVSTIIPVYNRPVLLAEAVESVIAQTYSRIEIIIVDDGSTVETASVCDQLAVKYWFIKVIHQAHSGLPGLARETGRLLARGEFIQYLDSDDLLLPQKFAVMTKALAEHPDCGIAYCYTRRYVKGERPRDVPCERTGETFSRMLPDFLDQRFWHTCTPLYRKSLCDKAGPWSDLAALEDMEYDMRIAKMNPRLYHCKDFLADFRDHAEPRLSTAGFLIDPESLRRLPRAYRLIYQHARNYGITYKDDAMRSFIGNIERLSHRCSEMGLSKEAEELAAIVHDVSGKKADSNVRHPRASSTMPSFSSIARQEAETLFSVDSLNERIVTQRSVPIVIALEQKNMVVTGWAVDREAKDTAGAVYVTIDGAPYPAHYSSDRKDVADHFGVPCYRYSGFEAVIADIEEGRHALSLVILTKDGRGYYLPAQTIEFDLVRNHAVDRARPSQGPY